MFDHDTVKQSNWMSRSVTKCRSPTRCFCSNCGRYEQLDATPSITYSSGILSTFWSSLLSVTSRILDCKCEDAILPDFQPNQELATPQKTGCQARLHN
jgi:hypothetical protein